MLVEPRRFSERHVGRVLANLEIHKVLIAPIPDTAEPAECRITNARAGIRTVRDLRPLEVPRARHAL